MEMGTTHHQTRWGVGIEGSLEKWPSHSSNVFLPKSWEQVFYTKSKKACHSGMCA